MTSHLQAWIGVAALALAATSASARAAPPVAQAVPFTTNEYGTPVVDDYRWMETPDSKPLAAWMRAQNAATRATLASIPGRADILKEIAAADNLVSFTGALVITPNKYFYTQIQAGQSMAKLYVRDVPTGKVTMLVDPSLLGHQGSPEAINFFQPSQDGHYVAYGVSADGSEATTLHVVSTVDLKDQGVSISRVRGENATFLPVWWLPDNSFAYYRTREMEAGENASGLFLQCRVWLHHLGQNANGDDDTAIFGSGVDPGIAVAPDQDALVKTATGSDYAFGLLTRNESNNVIDDVFVTPISDLEAGRPVWRRIAESADDVTALDAAGNEVFLLTYKDAPHNKIVEVNTAAAEGPVAFRDVVPQSDAIIRAFRVAKDGLYIASTLNGESQLARAPLSGGAVGTAQLLALPYPGTVDTLVANETEDGAVFQLESWTRSPLWYKSDPATRRPVDIGLQKAIAVGAMGLISKEVSVPSFDGTMIPLSIIMKADTRLDGRNPTLLIGYGSYGTTLTPGFDPSSIPWLNRGGIVAVAHVRGGGWYGEAWHKAGMKLTKLDTVFDYIACGQYLVDQGYTSPRFLAGKGTSAGGITIGGAFTWRPDLFVAAIDSHGLTDTLRAEFTPNGPPNIEEFGSVTTEAGFHGLYAMSAYENIRNGVPYPAVFLETGINDPRVAPWIVAKMAARLEAATSSGNPILLRVSYKSGHGFGSTTAQYESSVADELAFLLWRMGLPAFQPEQDRSEVQ
jgi:prolyl oligopeptidase